MESSELKQLLIEILDEYVGVDAEVAPKWKDAVLILQPQEGERKEVPLEVFFRKITSVRDNLRVLEQKINSHAQLSSEDKATFQGYITKSYGSLTTFNILFKADKDKFKGVSTKSENENAGMSVTDAKRRLGLNEY
ncbi:MAG: hypothetical protein AB7T49_15790 [Oligoflexales bacterium]